MGGGKDGAEGSSWVPGKRSGKMEVGSSIIFGRRVARRYLSDIE